MKCLESQWNETFGGMDETFGNQLDETLGEMDEKGEKWMKQLGGMDNPFWNPQQDESWKLTG